MGVERTRGHARRDRESESKRGPDFFLMFVVVVVMVVVYGLEEWRHLSLKLLLFSEVVSEAH